MKLSRMIAGVVLAVVAMGSARAEVFDLAIGDDSVRASLTGPLSRVFSQTEGQYDIGMIVRQQNDDDLILVHAGVLATGDTGMRDFSLTGGLGARLVYIGLHSEDGGTVAPGGQLQARFPGYERVSLSVRGYYGPDVLTFGDFESYYEIGGDVDYQLLRNASLYVGYRNVNVEIDNGSKVTVDNGWHGGLRLIF